MTLTPMIPGRPVSTRLVTLWCATACLLGLFAPPAAAQWRRIDSPNFIVIGDVSARDLREVAIQFESFRETLSRVLSARVTTTAVPTVVVVFPNDRAFTPFKPQYEGKPVDVAGVFYSGHDVNYITMVRDGRPGRLRIIFHEYAHLVISNVSMSLPAWLNEGLAEYYSTSEYRRGGREAMIGLPIESHLRLLERGTLLPLSQLIAVDQASALYNERERRSIFYAQSWALTHMLLLGEPSRVKELSAFVGHLEAGRTEADAWREAFGAAAIERDLAAYVRRDSFRHYLFSFPERLAAFEANAVPMAPPDVSGFLAALRVRQQRYEEALTLVASALQAPGGHAHAHVARAQLDLAREDYAAAAERLATLGEVDDWFVAYSAGAALTALVERSRETTPDRLEAARGYLNAVRAQRELPNVLARLALLDVMAPEAPSAGALQTIEQARALAPGRDDYALIHARLLAERGEFAEARSVLGPLLAPGVPEHVRTTARAWMGNVVRMEENRRADADWNAAAERRAAGSADPAPDASAPPTTLQLILRDVQAGEQRVEGTLARIDCPAGAPVVFHVTTPDGAKALAAPALGDVDFITYRSELTGSVACGPFEKPMPVYITWREGPKPGATRVVAVEYLPDR